MRKFVGYEYGPNIVRLCKVKGLSQEMAAERFLLSSRHVHNIQHNSSQVSARFSYKLNLYRRTPGHLWKHFLAAKMLWPDSAAAILSLYGQCHNHPKY